MSIEELLAENQNLKLQLDELNDLVDAIRNGEVDALAINRDGKHDIFTLESSDLVYRVLVENFGEGALNVTETGLIVYANSAFERLLQAPNSSIIGTFIQSLVEPGYEAEFKNIFRSAFSGNSKGEIVLFYQDRKIPVYVSLSSLYPKFAGIGIIITDLTEQKKQEARLEKLNEELQTKYLELNRSNKELASFSYIASHDLQEPLRKIQTFSTKILESDVAKISDKGQDYFRRIIGASSRMQNLINALFEYSRLNTRELHFIDTSLTDVLNEVISNLSDIIEEKNVTISVRTDAVIPVLPVQFQQLFTNLIDNAIKYSRHEADPCIDISTELVENLLLKEGDIARNYWKIKFADNGIGFDPTHNEKIFELFSRLHSKTEYSGTGIGLAICKKVAENHHGMINAFGVPGEGTTFEIFIPETQLDANSA